ncbi:hypothetical protein BS47DRAFT_1364760 [Hydnum rufescens UP504]|uniref:Uncharacterized protein n=1 Tax=Hydnum rufescens UP504 TaxID=1448309 RepID=A0A9P6AQQ5_9AGAM|nr:hypothetical protein BS47DRAFT_1364760 [Hydnum rufescens UP504]
MSHFTFTSAFLIIKGNYGSGTLCPMEGPQEESHQLSPSAKPDPNNAQTMPTAKYRSTQPPKTQTPSTIHKIHDDASNMVPHTHFSRCVAISCTSTVQYPTRRMHRSGPGQNTAAHSHPDPRLVIIHTLQNKYGATHLLWRLLSLSMKPHLMNGQRRPTVKYGVHSLHENPPNKPMKTRMSPQCNIQCAATQATSACPPKRQSMKLRTIHLPKWVCGTSRYIYCMISDPTNAQIRPRAKHRTMQPPISPDPQFPTTYKQNPHTMRPQKSWMNPTPASAGVIIFKTHNAAEQIHENSNPRPKQNLGTKPANEMTHPKVNHQATPPVPHPP